MRIKAIVGNFFSTDAPATIPVGVSSVIFISLIKFIGFSVGLGLGEGFEVADFVGVGFRVDVGDGVLVGVRLAVGAFVGVGDGVGVAKLEQALVDVF